MIVLRSNPLSSFPNFHTHYTYNIIHIYYTIYCSLIQVISQARAAAEATSWDLPTSDDTTSSPPLPLPLPTSTGRYSSSRADSRGHSSGHSGEYSSGGGTNKGTGRVKEGPDSVIRDDRQPINQLSLRDEHYHVRCYFIFPLLVTNLAIIMYVYNSYFSCIYTLNMYECKLIITQILTSIYTCIQAYERYKARLIQVTEAITSPLLQESTAAQSTLLLLNDSITHYLESDYTIADISRGRTDRLLTYKYLKDWMDATEYYYSLLDVQELEYVKGTPVDHEARYRDFLETQVQ